ncbi:MAG: hypothetical protein AAFQ36_09395 [Pseudomonadota bacterium]
MPEIHVTTDDRGNLVFVIDPDRFPRIVTIAPTQWETLKKVGDKVLREKAVQAV